MKPLDTKEKNALTKINTALYRADLPTVAPEKLLDFKPKHIEALRGKYISSREPHQIGSTYTPNEIRSAMRDLLNRIREGEVTTEQTSRESLVLSNPIKSYDTIESQAKLDAIETIIRGRA